MAQEIYIKYITEFTVDGKLYGGEIYAQSEEEAERILSERKKTERIVGHVPDVDYII